MGQEISTFPLSLKSKTFYYEVIGPVDFKFTETTLYIHLELPDSDLDFGCLDQKLVLPVTLQPIIGFQFFQRILTLYVTQYLKLQKAKGIIIMVWSWTGLGDMTQIVSGTMFGPKDIPLPI